MQCLFNEPLVSANDRLTCKKDQLTNFSHDTTNDQLFLASGADGSTELLVVPGVDLTLALDKGGVGVHIPDFLEQETVGAGVRGGGQDSGEVKDVSDGGVGQHVVAEVIGTIVTHQLGETDLVIDDEQGLTCKVSMSRTGRITHGEQ